MGFMTENGAKREKNSMDKVKCTGYGYVPLQSLSSLLVLRSSAVYPAFITNAAYVSTQTPEVSLLKGITPRLESPLLPSLLDLEKSHHVDSQVSTKGAPGPNL